MILWLAEDDYLQAETLKAELKRKDAFPNATVEVISTERAFRNRVKDAQVLPDVVILDVMMRWTDPSPNFREITPPDEVRNGEMYHAGIRCARILAEKFPEIPVILHTILEFEDLEPAMNGISENVQYIRKEPDANSLIVAIHAASVGQKEKSD